MSQYLTIELDGNTVRTRLSRRHWDEDCVCEDPDFEGEDVHDDIRTTMRATEVRVFCTLLDTGERRRIV